jgi:hypothetical protein
VLTSAVVSSAIPAPLWMSWLDGTSKVIGIAYAILGVIYLIKQIWKKM